MNNRINRIFKNKFCQKISTLSTDIFFIKEIERNRHGILRSVKNLEVFTFCMIFLHYEKGDT